MKAKSTIQKQIRRLEKLVENKKLSARSRRECYEAYHALRWVIEDVTWTPAGLLARETKEELQ